MSSTRVPATVSRVVDAEVSADDLDHHGEFAAGDEDQSGERSALLPIVQHSEGTSTSMALGKVETELPWRAGWDWLCTALVLSAAFFMHFTAWHATQNLQSTLPLHPTVSGTTALGIVYITHCLSGPMAPTIIQRLGPRLCIVIGQLCYGTFIAAQLFPRPYTIYPAATLVGLAASPLWAAQGLLITHFAVGFATARRSPDVASATGIFNGVFECAYGALTNIVGSVLSSLAFTFGEHVVQPDGSPARPTDATVHALFSLFLCFLFIGVALVVFGLPAKFCTPPPPQQQRTLWTTLRLLKERRMVMVLPLVVSSGLLSGFVTADFTRSVIVPSLGFDSIGFVIAINGSAGALAFLVLGKAIDAVNRSAVVAIGLGGYGTMICALLLFPPPSPGSWFTVCLIGVAGSIGNAAMTNAVVAYLSASFLDGKTAEAFGCKVFLGAGAQAASFFTSDLVEVRPKLAACTVVLVVGCVSFWLVEWEQRRNTVSNRASSKRPEAQVKTAYV